MAMVEEPPQFDFVLELSLGLVVFNFRLVVYMPADYLDSEFALYMSGRMDLCDLLNGAEASPANLFA